jgi:hypothetical protein
MARLYEITPYKEQKNKNISHIINIDLFGFGVGRLDGIKIIKRYEVVNVYEILSKSEA